MKSKKRWQHYCDHCSKSGANKAHMRAHEMKCFKNPARICPVCGASDADHMKQAVEYLEDNYWTEKEKAVAHVESMMDGCPACTMSAVMQTQLTEDIPNSPFDHDATGTTTIRAFIHYEYKQKLTEYIQEQNPVQYIEF